MKKKYIVSVLIVILSLISIYNVYDQVTNWAGLGENIRYIIVNLPLAVMILILSRYNKKLEYKVGLNKFISWLGFISCVILIIPPYVIYLFFIR
jgi:hypothetical protein